MRELEGRSYNQIGERLGMTKPVVESTLFRARRKLSEEYEELVTGRRCDRVQTVIADEGERPLQSLGIKERRLLARHLAHCQPCRRHARMAGVDESFFKTPSIAGKIAALLPIPWLRFRRGHHSGGGESVTSTGGQRSAAAVQSLQNAAAYVDPAGAGRRPRPHGRGGSGDRRGRRGRWSRHWARPPWRDARSARRPTSRPHRRAIRRQDTRKQHRESHSRPVRRQAGRARRRDTSARRQAPRRAREQAPLAPAAGPGSSVRFGLLAEACHRGRQLGGVGVPRPPRSRRGSRFGRRHRQAPAAAGVSKLTRSITRVTSCRRDRPEDPLGRGE